MTFKYVMNYFDNLVNFMSGINSNVNWNNVLNEIINMPVDKMFKRIKTYLWTDKNESLELDPITKNTFMYYTKLLYDYYDQLIDDKCCVLIVSEPNDDNDNLSINNEFIANKMKIKFNVLTELFDFKMIDYKLLNYSTLDELKAFVSPYKKILIFPTCSILYKEPNKLIDNFNNLSLTETVIVNDGYYNLYTTDSDIEFNLFRLMVIEMFNEPTITTNELLTKKYGMLKVK